MHYQNKLKVTGLVKWAKRRPTQKNNKYIERSEAFLCVCGENEQTISQSRMDACWKKTDTSTL